MDTLAAIFKGDFQSIRIAPDRIVLGRLLILFLVAVVLVSMISGAYKLHSEDLWHAMQYQFGLTSDDRYSTISYLLFQIRLPRVILAVLIGAGLSIAGASLQGLFRNSLADPSLIGITGGAMFFAVMGIVFAENFFTTILDVLGPFTICVFAFVGALLTTFLVYRLSTRRGRTSVATMLLAGIAFTALTSALTGLVIYYSSESELRDLTFWTMGSVSGANWTLIVILLPIIILSIVYFLKISDSLDLMLLGEYEATYAGVHVDAVKKTVIIVSALLVGICVAFSGVIGFVALVVPHLVRLLMGTSHKSLFIFSMILGGGLLAMADTFSRTIVAPEELPIGILTAILGAPFFLYLLVKRSNSNLL